MSYVETDSTSYIPCFSHDPEVIVRKLDDEDFGLAEWKAYGSADVGTTLSIRVTHALGSIEAEIVGGGIDSPSWSETVKMQIYNDDLTTDDGRQDSTDNTVSIEIKSSDGGDVRLYGFVMAESEYAGFTWTLTELFSGISAISGIGISPDGATLYYCTYSTGGTGGVYSQAVSGGSPTLLSGSLYRCQGLCNDSSYVYFNDTNSTGTASYIKRVPVGGGTTDTLNTRTVYVSWNQTQDGSKIYFTGIYNHLYSIPIGGGSTITQESTGSQTPRGFYARPTESRVFWTDQVTAPDSIRYVDLGESAPRTIKIAAYIGAAPTYNVRTLAVDSSYFYYTTQSTNRLCYMPRATGVEAVIDSSVLSSDGQLNLINYGLHLYIADYTQGKIYRASRVFT